MLSAFKLSRVADKLYILHKQNDEDVKPTSFRRNKHKKKTQKRKERKRKKKKEMRVVKFRVNGIKFEQWSIGVSMMMMNFIRVSRSSSWPGKAY